MIFRRRPNKNGFVGYCVRPKEGAMRGVILLASVSFGVCWAQLPERFTTIPGELSGHYWLSLSHTERVAYAYGFLAGYRQHPPDNTSVRNAAKDTCIAQLVNPDERQKFDCTLKSLDVKS